MAPPQLLSTVAVPCGIQGPHKDSSQPISDSPNNVQRSAWGRYTSLAPPPITWTRPLLSYIFLRPPAMPPLIPEEDQPAVYLTHHLAARATAPRGPDTSCAGASPRDAYETPRSTLSRPSTLETAGSGSGKGHSLATSMHTTIADVDVKDAEKRRLEEYWSRMEPVGVDNWDEMEAAGYRPVSSDTKLLQERTYGHTSVASRTTGERLRLLRTARRAVIFSGLVVMALWVWFGAMTGWTGTYPHRSRTSPVDTASDPHKFRWEDVRE